MPSSIKSLRNLRLDLGSGQAVRCSFCDWPIRRLEGHVYLVRAYRDASLTFYVVGTCRCVLTQLAARFADYQNRDPSPSLCFLMSLRNAFSDRQYCRNKRLCGNT